MPPEAAAKTARPFFGLGNAKRLSAMHVIPDRSAPDNLPIGEMVCEAGDLIPGARRQMTVEQLQYLGIRQVVYLRAGTCDGETAFLIHRADGTPIMMDEDLETAMAMVAKEGLIIVAVH
jgi:hypothetical protein